MLKHYHDMQHSHWFFWLLTRMDHKSLYLFGGTVTAAAITQSTANMVTAFFTVGVGMTTIIYNVVKTRNELRKERDRQKREAEDRPPVREEDED